MPLAVTVLSAVLAVAFTVTGGAKAVGSRRLLDRVSYLPVGAGVLRAAGLVEVAAAVGLLAGLRMPPVGLAAAAVLTAQSALAVAVHAWARRERESPVAAAVRIPATYTGALVLLLACLHVWA
ncbi:DoxX family protein [Nocardiopsis sp. EMB25]|uniref:DoxX family protein n=1 Tax=Nocardiopsis TaxID=2013 RepID=UPI00034CD4CC|nr:MULTISPECIES: DoxX family protein [Nocardiopsis]MCY9783598.1 DoxX family protein [Nocardiopsis sp. EMB25]